MPRRKTAMKLVEGARERAATYGRRAKGIKKKAEELATLCGVRVALVFAAGAAGVVPPVWESEEGVLESYRALRPEIHAQHMLRNHLEAEFCKERAKLARVQLQGPGALTNMEAGAMTPAEAQELLEAIDASLSITKKRLVALGLPAEGQLEQIAADAVMPQLGHDGFPSIGSNTGDMDASFQCTGGNYVGRRLEEFSWDDRFQMHNADMTQPGFGFQYTGGNYIGTIDSYGQMQAPGYGCPDHTMCYNGSCNGVLPVGYYYPPLGMGVGGHFIDGTAAPEQSVVVSGAAPLGYAMGMGMGGNFMNPESYIGYWQPPQDFHRGDDDTSTSQAAESPECPATGTSSSSKVFRYV